jgi:hypothetical protein
MFPIKDIQTKTIKINLLVLMGLIVLGSAFLTLAQNSSDSSKNIFLDSDQDGLSDEEEKTYGTDPRNKDTDGDGYSDRVEIESGYDPLKPAPGDKILTTEKTSSLQTTEDNLTQKLAREIVSMAEKSQTEGKNIDLESVQNMVNESIGLAEEEGEADEEAELSSEEMVISPEELKIKKQNYSKYSEEKQKEKRKEDFVEYLSAMYYIMSSNSPDPITSGTDFSSIIESNLSRMTQALTTRNASKVSTIKSSGEKIFEQAKEVEVPEELIDIHISALTFARSSIEMEKYIPANSADPIKDIQTCWRDIRAFNIKDHRNTPKDEDCGPGFGEIDHYKLFMPVMRTGLAIPLTFENIFEPLVPRPSAPEAVDALARRAREYVETVIRGLQSAAV